MAFGDLSDRDSKVSRWVAAGRSSQLLDELNTKPRVFYLERAE
jgi:Fe-S-cluster-containing dehydrogenase component